MKIKIIAISIIVIIIAIFGYNQFVKSKYQKEIESIINQQIQENGLEDIVSYDKIVLNTLSPTIKIKDVHIKAKNDTDEAITIKSLDWGIPFEDAITFFKEDLSNLKKMKINLNGVVFKVDSQNSIFCDLIGIDFDGDLPLTNQDMNIELKDILDKNQKMDISVKNLKYRGMFVGSSSFMAGNDINKLTQIDEVKLSIDWNAKEKTLILPNGVFSGPKIHSLWDSKFVYEDAGVNGNYPFKLVQSDNKYDLKIDSFVLGNDKLFYFSLGELTIKGKSSIDILNKNLEGSSKFLLSDLIYKQGNMQQANAMLPKEIKISKFAFNGDFDKKAYDIDSELNSNLFKMEINGKVDYNFDNPEMSQINGLVLDFSNVDDSIKMLFMMLPIFESSDDHFIFRYTGSFKDLQNMLK